MPKNPLKDYIWVIEKLMRRPMSFAELQYSYYSDGVNDDHKELQAKTFYNWRGKIQDIFSIRIEYAGDKYQIAEVDEPERKAALDWLVQSLAVNTALSHCRDLSKRILLGDIPSGEIYLESIIKAIKENRRVKIEYARFNESMVKDVVLEPFCIKVNNRRWYLLCRVPDGKSHHDDYPYFDRFGCIRIYALDRIQKLETLEEQSRAIKAAEEAQGISRFTVMELQDLYRVLVRRLHPDLHPDLSANLKDLFIKGQAAYRSYDIDLLRDIIKRLDMDEMTILVCDENLDETIDRLTRDIEEISSDIHNLRDSFPFNIEKDLLDPVWVKTQQSALKEEHSQLENQRAKYAERLDLLTV